MSELRTLIIVSIILGIVVGLTAYFPLKVPPIYSIIFGFATVVTFFFVILSTSFIFTNRSMMR